MAITNHRRDRGRRRAPPVFGIVNYSLAVIFILALAKAGCAPSIRYGVDKSVNTNANAQPPAQARAPATPRRDAPRSGGGVARRPARHLEQVANSYLGIPYKYGGTSRSGVDCSGFVILVYREVYGVRLPRSSRKMWEVGRQVPVSTARPGDLVFFKGGSFGAIDHVGIYMGNNRFIHSSTSKGVIYSNLNETYYSRRFAGVRRVI